MLLCIREDFQPLFHSDDIEAESPSRTSLIPRSKKNAPVSRLRHRAATIRTDGDRLGSRAREAARHVRVGSMSSCRRDRANSAGPIENEKHVSHTTLDGAQNAPPTRLAGIVLFGKGVGS